MLIEKNIWNLHCIFSQIHYWDQIWQITWSCSISKQGIAQLRYMDCLQIMRKWIHIVFISLSEGPSLIYAGELFTDIELNLLFGVMNFLFFKDILKIWFLLFFEEYFLSAWRPFYPGWFIHEPERGYYEQGGFYTTQSPQYGCKDFIFRVLVLWSQVYLARICTTNSLPHLDVGIFK